MQLFHYATHLPHSLMRMMTWLYSGSLNTFWISEYADCRLLQFWNSRCGHPCMNPILRSSRSNDHSLSWHLCSLETTDSVDILSCWFSWACGSGFSMHVCVGWMSTYVTGGKTTCSFCWIGIRMTACFRSGLICSTQARVNTRYISSKKNN